MTAVPDTAKQPQDRLKSAVQREAEADGPITLEWEGVPVVLPASAEEWDLDALEAIEDGKPVTTVRLLLGTRAYGELRAEVEKRLGRKATVGDIKPLVEAIAKAYGFESLGG